MDSRHNVLWFGWLGSLTQVIGAIWLGEDMDVNHVFQLSVDLSEETAGHGRCSGGRAANHHVLCRHAGHEKSWLKASSYIYLHIRGLHQSSPQFFPSTFPTKENFS